MKHIVLITILAVVLVGCGKSQQSATAPEAKLAGPVFGAIERELPRAKAPDISIYDASRDGIIKAIKQHLAAGTGVNVKDKYGL